MQRLHNWNRHATLMGVAVGLVVAGQVDDPSAASSADPSAAAVLERPAPEVTLTCDMDACVVRATYLLTSWDDDYSVTLRWTTTAAEGYPDNGADTLLRTLPARAGEPESDGYRYVVSDVVWHSDLRCDDTVTVEVTGDQLTPGSASVDKPVPTDPDNAYCSAYGMPGRI